MGPHCTVGGGPIQAQLRSHPHEGLYVPRMENCYLTIQLSVKEPVWLGGREKAPMRRSLAISTDWLPITPFPASNVNAHACVWMM